MLRLPGITKIWYVPADTLMSGITQRALANLPIGVFADIFPVPFVGEAICETETEFDNNDYRQKVQLTFSTTTPLPSCRLAFIIRTATGKQYLIGTADHPFPIVKSIDSTGELDGEKAATKYNITYTNKLALVPCNA